MSKKKKDKKSAHIVPLKFAVNGNTSYVIDAQAVKDELLPAVYELNFDKLRGLFLTKKCDKYLLPSKVYGLHQKFINRVIRSFDNTQENLGVMLTGIKGAGKTISCKQIANHYKDLPKVVINSNVPGLSDFISTFPQDCIFIFDEFEKNFKEVDGYDPMEPLLTVLDGLGNSQLKKLFLFTTNDMKINSNMKSRPSRLRYVKEFGNLSKEAVEEILEDVLLKKKRIKELESVISELDIITPDIVINIAQEQNLHKFKDLVDLISDYNVNKSSINYYVTLISGNSKRKYLKKGMPCKVIESRCIPGLEVISYASKNIPHDEQNFVGMNWSIKPSLGSIGIIEKIEGSSVTINLYKGDDDYILSGNKIVLEVTKEYSKSYSNHSKLIF